MATAIKIPELGTNVEQVKLISWLKKVGDHINRGEALCEVETDKAVSELESVAEGILLKQVVPKDTDVEQGTIIAYVGAPGETVPTVDQLSGGMDGDGTTPSRALRPEGRPSPSPTGSVQAVPMMIRNLAKKLGVDLARVTGTGPSGRILRDDVLKAGKFGRATASLAELGQAGRAAAGRDALALPSLSSHQTIIARRVMQSHREIPPINLACQVEMSAVAEYRRRSEKETGRKLSFDAFFVFAVARTMAEFPHFRSYLRGEKVILSETVNVGVAISIGDDLFTPVIRRADQKSITEIDTEVRQAADRAKKHLLQPDEMTGAGMTISNLGMYPVRSFAAIIPPDQSSALAIGCLEETPAVRNGSVKIVPMVIITLSVDHRLINGREAGKFLAQLKERMETLPPP